MATKHVDYNGSEDDPLLRSVGLWIWCFSQGDMSTRQMAWSCVATGLANDYLVELAILTEKCCPIENSVDLDFRT